MPAKLSKMAPIAAVAVILGYLCSPYFGDSAPATKPKTSPKSTVSLASLLNPTPAGDVRADLFEIPKVVGPAVAKKKPASSTSASQASAAKNAASAKNTDLKNFVLSGTYVAGGRRFAVINGALYSEGETITSTGRGGKTAFAICTVSRVEIDKVVLSFEGQTKELHYADPSLPPDPKSNSAGVATSAVIAPAERTRDADVH
jgi:hypothetical protein